MHFWSSCFALFIELLYIVTWSQSINISPFSHVGSCVVFFICHQNRKRTEASVDFLESKNDTSRPLSTPPRSLNMSISFRARRSQKHRVMAIASKQIHFQLIKIRYILALPGGGLGAGRWNSSKLVKYW